MTSKKFVILKVMPKLLPRILLVLGLLLVVFPSSVQAASVLDQYEYVPLPPNEDANFWYIKRSGSNVVKQTFKPTKNKLDKVYVWVNGNGSTATITMDVRDAPANLIGSMSASVPSSTYGSSFLFDFSTDLSVTPEAVYQIILTTASTTAYWRIDEVPEYTRGNAVVDGVVKTTQDFGFRTYGYDEAPPPPASPATPPPAEESAPAEEQPSTTPITNQNTADETSQNTATTAASKTESSTKSATPSSKKEGPKKDGFNLFSPIVLAPLAILVLLVAGLVVWFLVKRKPKQTTKPEKEISVNSPPPQPTEEKQDQPTS